MRRTYRRRGGRLWAVLVALLITGSLAVVAANAGRHLPRAGQKTCSPGYTYADLSWGEKCLRAGEFCKVGNPEYHKYGFDCPADGHLIPYSASGKPGQAQPAPEQPTSTRKTCGVERWTVKTLQDRPALLQVKKTTIAYLVSRREPNDLPVTRMPFERRVFQVTANVILERPEADGDFHLVLTDGTHTMIAETPSPACDKRATPARRRQMTLARKNARLCSAARVTGVAFFDFQHGQTGVAPNAIELHPVLSFKCLQA